MRRVVIGFLGTVLDRGKGPRRWENWRPTVAVCRHEDLLVDRLELLVDTKLDRLARDVAADIGHVSPETNVVINHVDLSKPWDLEHVYGLLHDFARAYEFDVDNEEYLIHITTGSHVCQICEFLLTESHYFPAKLLQSSPPKRGAASEPGGYAIIDLDLSKYDKIATRFAAESHDDISFLKSGIDTKNEAFNAKIAQIERVAMHARHPMLLTGPTGAGKSELARRIYELKKLRRQVKGRFVEVNCATLRGDAAMSALFGHKKGAFTGAMQDRSGLLVAADAGMLFLDEVGELGADEQAMLLRAVEDKRFLPVGSDVEVRSDFQLICGTNRDLQVDVAKGDFREDLLSRINLWTFELPGLRDRPEDIAPNVQYELDRYAETFNTRITFNKEAQRMFLSFATSSEGLWPANFRDLNASIARMATLAPGGRINEQVVSQEIERLRTAWSRHGGNAEGDCLDGLLDEEQLGGIDLFDRRQLAYVVEICRRSRSLSDAGRKLFDVSRLSRSKPNDADRLRKYLARFGLDWRSIREPAR